MGHIAARGSASRNVDSGSLMPVVVADLLYNAILQQTEKTLELASLSHWVTDASRHEKASNMASKNLYSLLLPAHTQQALY